MVATFTTYYNMAENLKNRLLTPEFQSLMSEYPLYSQDNRQRNAVCLAVFSIGNVRWYVLEGEQEGNDFTLYGIVVGLQATEYGYASLNEMAEISVDASEYGMGTMEVCQEKEFAPCRLEEIQDAELQEFLSRLYD